MSIEIELFRILLSGKEVDDNKELQEVYSQRFWVRHRVLMRVIEDFVLAYAAVLSFFSIYAAVVGFFWGHP